MVSAMTYERGETVLVHRLTGGVLKEPITATVLKPLEHSSLYAYRVRSGIHDMNVREAWLAPFEIVIQEIPDTPWD